MNDPSIAGTHVGLLPGFDGPHFPAHGRPGVFVEDQKRLVSFLPVTRNARISLDLYIVAA